MPIDKATQYRNQGRLWQYVYFLVQGERNAVRRSEQVEEYARKHRLTKADRKRLAEELAELDRKRSEPKPVPVAPAWTAEPATDKQKAALKRAAYKPDVSTLTKGQASKLIARLKKLDDDFISDDPIDGKLAGPLMEDWQDGL